MTGSTKLMTPSGGGVTLTPTNTATDKTLTIPADNGTLVYANSSGNVGIGTNSSTGRFTVDYTAPATFTNAAGDFVSMWRASGTNALGVAANTTGTVVRLVTNNGYQLAFNNAATETMRIDSSGNLLVGTTSNLSGGKLIVKAAAGYNIGEWRVGTNGYAQIMYNASDVQVGYISINASTTTYATTSDYRLKENIQPMQNALSVVSQLNPVTYTWKADGSDGQGFIAHELQAVVPDCVTGEKDAVRIVDVLDDEGKKIGTKEEPVYQGIDTSFLVATLTKAIQELKEELDEAKARITALESK